MRKSGVFRGLMMAKRSKIQEGTVWQEFRNSMAEN